jgi:glycosyltransferase involved in cell wall biosynthesis
MGPVQGEGIEQLRELLGRELGPNDWMEITQEDVDMFADVSRPSQGHEHATHHGEDPLLFAKLEAGIPERLPLGKGNALFVSGWCYHRERKIIGLGIRAGPSEHRVLAHSMPRSDVYAARDKASDPHGYRYRSGFWAIVPLEPATAGAPADIELLATLSTGDVSTKRLASIALESVSAVDGGPPSPPARESAEPLIAICMTTYNPRLDLFRVQIASLREQTHENWICVVSDDCSRPDVYAGIREELEGDERFFLSQSDKRLGYYRNFERVLGLVPQEAELVALCDQDDHWHQDKLEALREAAGPEVTLAYCDMNLVDEDGNLISPTYWTERRTNHTNMTSLMVANTITAAASLFPRRLLDYALPFPAPLGHAFHDHWLALVALARGRIAYVDRPLYDYVQHSANAFGSRGASWKARREGRPGRLRRLVPTRAGVSTVLLRWRLHYFYNACPARLHAEILLLRCGEELRGRKRRAVKRMLKADRSLPLAAWLALRSIAARLRRSPTMGQERLIARGILWRRFVPWQALVRRRRRGTHVQALPAPPPPPPIKAAPADAPPMVAFLSSKIAPLRLSVNAVAEPRVNMLIPTVDLMHFFGAYIGKLNLARRLAEHGLQVRIVAVDPTHLPDDWRDQIRGYEGLGSLLDQVEVEFALDRELLRLEVSPRDCFMATTSWTAHLAHRATQEVGRERFVFVIQEYDPLVFPVGTMSAVARQAYTYPHFAVFSTEFLRDYFRNHRLGVFATGREEGERASVTFQNAITAVDPPPEAEMRRQAKSLLFYARPEPHAERNMFELGVMALAEAIHDGCFPGSWQFYGIGALEHGWVRITDEVSMEILSRQSQDAYRGLLREHSIGLSLMDTPHPSLVPLEMASAGMLVVTSTFENKTAESLRAISENLIPVEPTVDGIKRGLGEAVNAIGAVERRLQGSRVNWSRSWQASLDDQLIERIKAFLEAA